MSGFASLWTSDVFEELRGAWMDKNSSIFMTKNLKTLIEYCRDNGLDLKRGQLSQFLEEQNSSNIRNDNISERRISQLSKSFVTRGKFFSQLHGDIFYITKKNLFKTAKKYVMVICCQLSRMVFLEALLTLRYESKKRAITSIFERIKSMGGNVGGGTFFSDGGADFASSDIRALLSSYKMKSNVIKKREGRLSKGSAVCESRIRTVRKNLEMVVKEKNAFSFEQQLRMAELACNSQVVSSIGMSPFDALNMRPMDLAMISSDMKIRRNKYFRKELYEEQLLSVGTIVRIKFFVSKKFSSVVKESYGRLSVYFIIIEIERQRPLSFYKLADIFTFQPLHGTFSRAELLKVSISHIAACRKMQFSIKNVIKYDGGLVMYHSNYRNHVFVASDTLLRKMND